MSDFKEIYKDEDIKLFDRRQTDVEDTTDAPRTVVLKIGENEFGFEIVYGKIIHAWEKKNR